MAALPSVSIMPEKLLGSALSSFCGKECRRVIPKACAEAVLLPSNDSSAGPRFSFLRACRVVQATLAVFDRRKRTFREENYGRSKKSQRQVTSRGTRTRTL